MGHLIAGTEVLLQVRDNACRLVGALSDPPQFTFASGERVDTVTPFIVEVLSTIGRGLAIAANNKGQRVTMLHNRKLDVRRGDRFAVVAIDVKPRGRERVIVRAVSSRLP